MSIHEAISTLHEAGYLVKLFGEADIRQELEQRGEFSVNEESDIILFAQSSDHWQALLDGTDREQSLIADAVAEGIEALQTLKD